MKTKVTLVRKGKEHLDRPKELGNSKYNFLPLIYSANTVKVYLYILCKMT